MAKQLSSKKKSVANKYLIITKAMNEALQCFLVSQVVMKYI